MSNNRFRGVKSDDSIAFFDWETQTIIRRIEVAPKGVYWNEDGTKVALCLDESLYVLRCNKESIAEYLLKPSMHNDEGLESAFDVELELAEAVMR